MSQFASELIASMKQATAHANGRKVRGMRVTTVEMPDVKAIRRAGTRRTRPARRAQ
jgi:putative transcriptional regulator